MSDEKKKLIRNSTAEFLTFTAQSGDQSIEARYEEETIWLTQKLIATLFDVSVPTINEHLKNIIASGELAEEAVIRKFLITATDGKPYNTLHYNLDAIISVGYRVNSVRATQFRQWATQSSDVTSAPKVQPIVAQGIALGFIRHPYQSPERAA